MRFSWDFLQNMLENAHSNLQTNFWVHITSNIFKISNSKITGSHQPPLLPTLKAYPTPAVGGRFGIFSLKWRERMNLKVPGAILPLGCAILSTRAKTVRGVGTTPLRRTRVKGCGMSPWLVLVSPCLRKNVVATCKIASFLCCLDNLLQKNVSLFWKSNFKMALIWKKGIFLTYFSHFLVTRERLQKFLQHISHSHTYTYFAHTIDFFCLTNFEKKIQIYQIRFLFGMSPSVDSYSRHFGTINK